MVRAKLLRELGSVGTAVDRDHLKSHMTGILHTKVAKPADPEYRDQVARPRGGIPKGTERRDAGTQQRRCVDR